MSTSGLSVSSSAAAPITVTGLASGLNTSAIIAALMNVEREPVAHMTAEQQKFQAEQATLQGLQGSLQQLSTEVSEFALPSLFEQSQTVTSSEPARVGASASAGAAVGGYEVEVTKLANAAQRSFAFTSPASEDTVTIDGQEFKVKPGETAKELASAINSNTHADVYAAALENGTIVLSSRTTGATGGEFIKVTDTGATLKETGTAKEGQNAEYKVDGVAASSATNTVTNAIPGVTLTLGSLTPQGPVTIDVAPPGPSASKVEAQLQSFVKLYNSTVETIQQQLDTKPSTKGLSGGNSGILFGDTELSGLLNRMRQAMYEPLSGLEGSITSPSSIGLNTGAPTGSTASTQSSLSGLLTLDPDKLSEALSGNPAGVEKMMQQWSQKLQTAINNVSGPGGTMQNRITGDSAQISRLGNQISNMNEMLLTREKALQQTYAALEAAISRNTAQDAFLAKQAETFTSSSSGSSSTG